MSKNERVYWLLPLLGLLPFIGALTAELFSLKVFATDMKTAFFYYSIVIICFLSGALWGQITVAKSPKQGALVLVFSNIIAVIAWLVLLVFGGVFALVFLAIAYIGIYMVETIYLSDVVLPEHYRFMRLCLTVLVVGLHGLAIMIF